MSRLALSAVTALLLLGGGSCTITFGHSSGNGHLFGAGVAGMGLLLMFGAFQIYRKFRLLKDTPQMEIGNLATGLVHIYGKPVAAKRLTSPITQLPCFYYEVRVEFWDQQSRSSRWVAALRDTDNVKFGLQDASGKVPIDLHQSQLDLSDSFRAEIGKNASKKRTLDQSLGDWNGPLDQELLNYLAEANARIHAGLTISPESWVGNVKQSVDAAVTMASSPVGYKDGSVTTLPADLPEDIDRQRIRFTEQCIFPDREYNVLGTCFETQDAADEHDRRFIGCGPKGHNFLISSRAEPALEKRTLWTSILLLVLAGILILAGAYLYVSPSGDAGWQQTPSSQQC